MSAIPEGWSNLKERMSTILDCSQVVKEGKTGLNWILRDCARQKTSNSVSIITDNIIYALINGLAEVYF